MRQATLVTLTGMLMVFLPAGPAMGAEIFGTDASENPTSAATPCTAWPAGTPSTAARVPTT